MLQKFLAVVGGIAQRAGKETAGNVLRLEALQDIGELLTPVTTP